MVKKYKPELKHFIPSLEARFLDSNAVGDYAMGGSFLIKSVFPDIFQMTLPSIITISTKFICELDTFALVKIWEELVRISK